MLHREDFFHLSLLLQAVLLLNFYEVLVFIRVDIVSAAAAMLWEMGDLELLQFKNMVKKVSRWFCLVAWFVCTFYSFDLHVIASTKCMVHKE